MIDADRLAKSFLINLQIIQMQTNGLTHADSMEQLPFRGNCLNWVLGHIVANRNRILELLGGDSIWENSANERYKRGSEPITNEEEGILNLKVLLADLERTQERLNLILENMSLDDFNREIDVRGDKMTLGQRLFFFYFHETYHTGQTELLRQLTGKDDAVIS